MCARVTLSAGGCGGQITGATSEESSEGVRSLYWVVTYDPCGSALPRVPGMDRRDPGDGADSAGRGDGPISASRLNRMVY